MFSFKKFAYLLEKQTQDLKESLNGSLKNMLMEFKGIKEEVSNRNDEPIVVADDSSKQGGKLSAEEESEIMEMEKGMSESCSSDKDTLPEKIYSHSKATIHKNQLKDIWICGESNRLKGASWKNIGTDIGVQEVQLPQDLSMCTLRERLQVYFPSERPIGQNISQREPQDVISLDMRPP